MYIMVLYVISVFSLVNGISILEEPGPSFARNISCVSNEAENCGKQILII
jgi:hypothetical protein